MDASMGRFHRKARGRRPKMNGLLEGESHMDVVPNAKATARDQALSFPSHPGCSPKNPPSVICAQMSTYNQSVDLDLYKFQSNSFGTNGQCLLVLTTRNNKYS